MLKTIGDSGNIENESQQYEFDDREVYSVTSDDHPSPPVDSVNTDNDLDLINSVIENLEEASRETTQRSGAYRVYPEQDRDVSSNQSDTSVRIHSRQLDEYNITDDDLDLINSVIENLEEASRETTQRSGAYRVYPEQDSDVSSNQSDTSIRIHSRQLDEYVVDPQQTTIIPIIDGEVVPDRRCYLKVLGFLIFDDSFFLKINPRLIPFVLITIVIVSVLGAIYMPSNDSALASSTNQASLTSMAPSTKALDERSMNIIQALHNVSGDLILDEGTSQHKALTWILDEDGMNLTHTSRNLVQRYILMVFYYSLSGDNWGNKNGYGTDGHECDWFGVTCTTQSNKMNMIRLEKNGLEGNLPNELDHLSNARRIILPENRISGSIPSRLCKITRLRLLHLGGNSLSGTISDEMRKCTDLKELDISSNNLIGTLPVFSGEQRFLKVLKLSRNQFTGTIPPSFFKLPMLEVLSLAFNRLTGSISPELGSLRSLVSLDLEENKLVGTIPSSLSNLTQLRFLRLNENLLTGTIPGELGMLSNLIQLRLSSNSFTGTIPEALGSLSEVNEILLANNRINGTIPTSFENLNELNVLELHGNMIIGNVGSEICGLRIVTLTSDCAGLEAKISCSCCTECF